LAHIDQHMPDRLDVDRLSAVAGLSRAHFVRVFSQAVGESPSAYVIDQRLQLAQRLLTATDATVNEIAVACGFADANYFAKVFRRKTDTTPSAYRADIQPR
jgi:transcriptional regulator GlxA family with amidase domain